jgi:hypothetical protein
MKISAMYIRESWLHLRPPFVTHLDLSRLSILDWGVWLIEPSMCLFRCLCYSAMYHERGGNSIRIAPYDDDAHRRQLHARSRHLFIHHSIIHDCCFMLYSLSVTVVGWLVGGTGKLRGRSLRRRERTREATLWRAGGRGESAVSARAVRRRKPSWCAKPTWPAEPARVRHVHSTTTTAVTGVRSGRLGRSAVRRVVSWGIARGRRWTTRRLVALTRVRGFLARVRGLVTRVRRLVTRVRGLVVAR